MATNVTAGNVAAFTLGPYSKLTLSSARGVGNLVLTSAAPKLVADQSLSIQNGTFGPYGCSMAVSMTVLQGAVDYTVTDTANLVTQDPSTGRFYANGAELTGIGGSGGAMDEVAFTTAITFASSSSMGAYVVTGALAFTVDSAGAKEGSQVVVDLIANGANTPTFTGFRKWDGSADYADTLNVRNCITFFRRGGANWYTINQEYGMPAEPLPATALSLTGPASGVVSTASSNFTVATNGSWGSAITVTPSDSGAGGTFTPSTVNLSAGSNSSGTFTYTPASTGAKTISITSNSALTNPSGLSYNVLASPTVPDAPTALNHGALTGTTVSLTWSAPANNGGAAITDYVVQWALAGSGSWTTFADGTNSSTGATVTGLSGSTSYDFRVAAVNSVGQSAYSSTHTVSTTASGPATLRMLSLTDFTESGDASAGWNYTGTASYTTMKSVSEKKLASGQDGYIQIKIGYTPSGSTKQIWLGFGTSSSPQIYSGMSEMIDAADVYSYMIGPNNFVAYSSPYTNLPVALNDLVRLRRAGSTLYHEISKDNGSSWTAYRSATVTTGDIWFYISGDGAGVAADVRHSGLT